MALVLASRLCRAPVLNKSLAVKPLQIKNVYRTFAEEGRDALARTARRRQTLKEKLMAPAGDTGELYENSPILIQMSLHQSVITIGNYVVNDFRLISLKVKQILEI